MSKDGEYDVVTNKGSGPNSYYETYWLNPSTMRVGKEIWNTSVPTSRYGALCPAMQRLPRVGTFAAEIINSGTFLLKWFTGALLYTPGMSEVWKAGGRCPEPGASRRHSVLVGCGDELFSLDDFFDSLDDASAVFWYSLNQVAVMTNPNLTPNPITDVLEGMAQYGQGTVDAYDLWQMRGMVMTLTKVPIKDQAVALFATISDTASSFSKMSDAQVLGSAKSVALSAFRINVGGIAWARFTYKCVSQIVLVIAKASLARESITEAGIWQAVWGVLYDLKAYYTSTITERNRMGCAGLRMMFGTSNPFAKASPTPCTHDGARLTRTRQVIYYGCTSAAGLSDDLFSLMLNVAVEIPLVKCVCKDAAGADIRRFVQTTCTASLPLTLRPKLFMIVNQLQGTGSARFKELACARVTDDLKTLLTQGLDQWFEPQYAAMTALGDTVDYLMVGFDKSAGKCQDFLGDPHVVVIVPEPVDYFSRCSRTVLCKGKCASEWATFQARNHTPVPLNDLTVQSESLFFPGQYDAAMVLSNAVAVTETDGVGVCVERVPHDFAVVVAELAGKQIKATTYCIPQACWEPVLIPF